MANHHHIFKAMNIVSWQYSGCCCSESGREDIMQCQHSSPAPGLQDLQTKNKLQS